MFYHSNHVNSNPGLEFVAAPALKPAEVHIDPELIAQYQAELKQARNFSSLDLVGC